MSKVTKHFLVHTHQIKQDVDNAMALRWEVKMADASGECRGGGHLSTALLSEEAAAAASRGGLVVRRRVGGDCLASQLRTLCLLRHVSSLHGHAGHETSVGSGGVSAPGARGNAGVSLFHGGLPRGQPPRGSIGLAKAREEDDDCRDVVAVVSLLDLRVCEDVSGCVRVCERVRMCKGMEGGCKGV